MIGVKGYRRSPVDRTALPQNEPLVRYFVERHTHTTTPPTIRQGSALQGRYPDALPRPKLGAKMWNKYQ